MLFIKDEVRRQCVGIAPAARDEWSPRPTDDDAGSTGYEPFSGSGTTLVAAEQCGLACCAVELDPAFAAVALERLHLLGVQCRKADA
jgi:hypothetical protein